MSENMSMTSIQNSVDEYLQKNVLNNSIVLGLLTAMLAIYGPRLHPRLPDNIRKLFSDDLNVEKTFNKDQIESILSAIKNLKVIYTLIVLN